ncbi:MAG TPA: biotin carboxylase N-terminal domain-containing protein [Planctomycetota bacterium]|nr:biotin carboxylase N-terminal domain-containing protein [Planctomycetota bacterium]
MKVLVANRGEIACRVLRALREMGLPSVAVVAAGEEDEPHADLASEIVMVPGPEAYLDPAAMVAAARRSGAQAVHPGYGFLSQSAAFARACRDAGIVFIGPPPEAMAALGDKRAARRTAEGLGIPVLPGAREVDAPAAAEQAAARVGYPVLLKAAGGGGGRGMRRVERADEMPEAFESARREAAAAFGDDRLLLEKYLSPARHVEVQILADGREAVAVGERECSLQRRYQKVIEEAPCAALSERARQEMFEAAVKLARAVGYRSAGTVEFLVGSDGRAWFLEVNTRLQVEHPVTELVTGIDLVRAQIELAQGARLPSPAAPRGHAIEARLNAEDPYRGFLPQTGKILGLHFPHRPGLRVDAGIREGSRVGTRYDPLLAKLVAWGKDRETARRRLIEALRETVLLGVVTNLSFLLSVLESDVFVRGETFTTTLEAAAWPEPPVPPEAAEAARRVLAAPSGEAGGGPSDLHSPWATMGPFRVGS